ncbi:MAG TPA: helix-turn-helix transcriptional regulator [Flavilitoribacter sp.]|nr:helix-turn-helix transcriptional regulator [Flavilitoribacter sp.]HMQ88925.1 helix-turn-helix transcriptional regulator [Flavilitoribacter sp.]
MKNEPPEPDPKIEFTGHQLTIIQLWSEEQSAAAVAKVLDLSEHTVLTHLKRMRRKLRVRRTFEVYKYARDKNLIK